MKIGFLKSQFFFEIIKDMQKVSDKKNLKVHLKVIPK